MSNRIDYTAALSAFVLSLIAGAVTYLRHQGDHSMMAITAALFASGIAGLACWLLCTALHLPDPLTAICTGLAGHMGAELTRLIQQGHAPCIASIK